MSDVAADAPKPASVFGDDAWSSADGTRAAAKWIASALGAIPSLAVVASVIRAPGDSGFYGGKLTLGILLAALGALIGIVAFAWVLTPVRLSDDTIGDFDMSRLLGNPHSKFIDLQQRIETIRDGIVSDESALAEAERIAGVAKASAAAAAAKVARLKVDLEAAAESAKPPLLTRIAAAEAELAAATAEAETKSEAAVDEARDLKAWSTQFARHSALRRQVYELKASDQITHRFSIALGLTFPSVLLVAVGVILLGLAPKPKAEPPDAPSLVTLELNDAGRAALDCTTATSLVGVRFGGDDDAPYVITFPIEGCPAKGVEFKLESDAFGTIEEAEAISSP